MTSSPGPSEVTPQALELTWTLRGPGSARFTWTCGPDSVVIGTSYVGDALPGVFRAAIDLSLGSSATFTHLLSEPSGHRIFFSGAAEEVYVQIVVFEDLYSPANRWAGAECRWDGHIRTRAFIDAVLAMADQIRADYPGAEYEERWGLPFPVEVWERLRAVALT